MVRDSRNVLFRGNMRMSLPRSFTWITLPSFSSRLSMVVALLLGMSVPSSFVTRSRWIENLASVARR